MGRSWSSQNNADKKVPAENRDGSTGCHKKASEKEANQQDLGSMQSEETKTSLGPGR